MAPYTLVEWPGGVGRYYLVCVLDYVGSDYARSAVRLKPEYDGAPVNNDDWTIEANPEDVRAVEE